MAMNRRRFVQAAGVGAGLGLTGAGWAFHDSDFGISALSGAPYVQPTYGDIAGLEILGFNDMSFGQTSAASRAAGWDQTYDFKVVENGHGRFAYCPNGAKGWSVLDVSNPRRMSVVFRQPHSTLPDNTQYLDIKGGNILVIKRNQRLENWDVSNPAAPVLKGFYTPPDIGNLSYHGMWIHEDYRGRFVFAACGILGFTNMILLCVDITDPVHPRERGRFWYPGMNTAAGEVPTWPTTPYVPAVPGLPLPTVQCHDMTTYGDRCYAAWRDKGLQILDITDIDHLRRVGQVNWADGRPDFPSLPGQTHSFGIVVPKHGGPVQTVVATDELGQCPFGYMHFLDVSNEALPREISGFRVPLNMHANCPKDRLGNRMGIHDVERMITGNIVWSAWEEGGFWGVDFSDIHYPRWAGYYVPPVRRDSERQTGHADDVFVMRDGTIFGCSSDQGAGGLWAMRFEKRLRGKVTWNTDESNVIVTRTDRHGDHEKED
jgi:hypothetical protein